MGNPKKNWFSRGFFLALPIFLGVNIHFHSVSRGIFCTPKFPGGGWLSSIFQGENQSLHSSMGGSRILTGIAHSDMRWAMHVILRTASRRLSEGSTTQKATPCDEPVTSVSFAVQRLSYCLLVALHVFTAGRGQRVHETSLQ